MKQTKESKKTRQGSIKTMIFVIPLIIVLVGEILIGAISTYIMRESILNEMRRNGFIILQQVIDRIKDSHKSLASLNDSMEEKLYINKYQEIVDDLGKEENIVYALFIDKNLRAVAHSNKERIGIELSDEGSKTAAVDGKPYSSIYFYEAKKVKVYDVLLPVFIDGKHIGAVNIGFSMEKVQEAINKNIMIFIVVGLIVFGLMAIALYISSNTLIKAIYRLKEKMQVIASGDLTISTINENYKRNDEIAQMGIAMDNMINNMREIIASVKDKSRDLSISSNSLSATSEEMASSSQELARTMQQVAAGASTQANDLQDIVNLMGRLTNNIENVYKELQNVKNETNTTTDRANHGKKEMDKLVKSIEEIRNAFEVVVTKVSNLTNSVKQISNITDVITSISEQTNLLALNAAIEAARAGEAGRGFAVVADEVRKLAEESKKSTSEIIELVESIQLDTEEVINTSNEVESFIKSQTSSVENTVGAFAEILESIEKIAPLMNRTYEAMDEIVESKDEVLSKLETVSAITQENSAASEEVAASSEELSASSEEVAATAQNLNTMAKDLDEIVSKFKV